MDFEKYIGKEKPLLDRAALNAYERRGNAGTLDYAEDELRLLATLKDVKAQIAEAEAVTKAMSEQAESLRELEASIGKKGAATQKRIEEWESSFDTKYNDLLKRVEDEVAALEQRNRELITFARAQEEIFNARSAEITSKADASEAGIRQASDNAYQEMSDILVSMKKAQKEFETSISGKLEEDKQTIDRIKYMLSTMSDIIKS